MQKLSIAFVLSALFMGLCGIRAGEDSGDIITLTHEEIKAFNVNSIQELLNRLPGISASGFSVKIRGSSKVKVIVDGKPINNPLSAHSSVKWGLVSFASIDSIKIYKGSSAVMFGEGTDGGAIEISRKTGNQSSMECEVIGGNYGLFEVEGVSNYNLSNHACATTFHSYHSDGYRENQDKDRYDLGFSDVIRWHEDKYTFSGSINYSWEERGSPGYPAYPRLLAREKSEAFTGSGLFSSDRLKNSFYFQNFLNRSTDPERDLESEIKSVSFGDEMEYKLGLPNGKSLPLGLSFETTEFYGTEIAKRDEQKAAIYSSWKQKLADSSFSLHLASRFNWYSSFDSAFDPSAKLSWKGKGFWFHLGAGKGHTVPPIRKRYQRTSTRIPNPFLGMEHTYKLDLEVGYAAEEKFKWSTTVYAKRTDDRITYTRLDGGYAQYRNIGEASWLGWETTVDYSILPQLNASFTYTRLEAKDEENDLVLTASPKHTFQCDLEWEVTDQWKVILRNKYRSMQYVRSDNSESVTSYLVSDLRVEYQRGRMKFFGLVENILDRDYKYGDGLPGAPMEWQSGLQWSL